MFDIRAHFFLSSIHYSTQSQSQLSYSARSVCLLNFAVLLRTQTLYSVNNVEQKYIHYT